MLGAVPRVMMDISLRVVCAACLAGSPMQRACVTDIRALAWRPASCDLVYSPSTLDHFLHGRDIPAALSELGVVLRPGGRLLLTLDNPSNPLVRARNALWQLVGPVNPLIPFPMGRTLSRAALVNVLERVGFEVLRSGYVVHAPRTVTC